MTKTRNSKISVTFALEIAYSGFLFGYLSRPMSHDDRVADARADSARRIAEQQVAVDERLAEARGDSAQRIAEIESNFQENRARSLQQYQNNLENAASRLDGRAVAELGKRFGIDQGDAVATRDGAIAKEKANLQERIDEENDAHTKRLSAEANALDKSIKQQQSANTLRLEEQAINDAQRVEDMKVAFIAEQTQAATERGIRLTRQAQDHNDNLNAMASAHTARISQIKTQAADERTQLDTEFKTKLGELKLETV